MAIDNLCWASNWLVACTNFNQWRVHVPLWLKMQTLVFAVIPMTSLNHPPTQLSPMSLSRGHEWYVCAIFNGHFAHGLWAKFIES